MSYTDVVQAQAAALSARRALVQLQVNRQAAAIALIQAMGGGWQADWMGATRPAGNSTSNNSAASRTP